MRKEQPRSPARETREGTDEHRVIPVRRLLGEDRAVRLEHDGDLYLLRITRNGKLILTK